MPEAAISARVRAVQTHQEIDQRSLAMARAIVGKIDRNPARAGSARAQATCRRWLEHQSLPAFREWLEILARPWEEVRTLLLDEWKLGQRLRQSDPFCGILTPRERWEIYHAHGVSPEKAVLPANWRSRLVAVQNENTRGITDLCLSPVDLAISKLLAGREKDLLFVTAMT